MENVILVIHLFLALGLIVVVLMQRSEGGGLGIGGGGGAMTAGRAQATALGKLTWILAIAFIGTSIALTIIAAQNAAGVSVVDNPDLTAPATNESNDPILPPLGDNLTPPTPSDSTPLVPSAD